MILSLIAEVQKKTFLQNPPSKSNLGGIREDKCGWVAISPLCGGSFVWTTKESPKKETTKEIKVKIPILFILFLETSATLKCEFLTCSQTMC